MKILTLDQLKLLSSKQCEHMATEFCSHWREGLSDNFHPRWVRSPLAVFRPDQVYSISGDYLHLSVLSFNVDVRVQSPKLRVLSPSEMSYVTYGLNTACPGVRCEQDGGTLKIHPNADYSRGLLTLVTYYIITGVI